jgi:LysR family pca operon transcriptional activator
MLDQLRLGDLSLVVGRLARPNQMQGLSFTHLYSEKLVCAVRADHPLMQRDSFDAATLQHMTILIPSKDGVMRPAVDRFLVANGLGALPHGIEARSTGFCRQFILDTDAIWIISRGVVEHDLQNGILGALNIDTSDTQGAVGLTVRADSDPSPTLRMMMDTIVRVAHEQTLTYPEYFSHASE